MVGEAKDGREDIYKFRQLILDIVLMDFDIPNNSIMDLTNSYP